MLGTALPSQAQTATAGQLVISEFRVRGPNGANDEYIVIQNLSGADHTVTSASGTGYGVAASDGTTRFSIPNGTVIPNQGYYLGVNSVGYSLASYPAGNGTTATGDATWTTDIPDNAGIAIFNNNTGGGSYVLANRLDAVGSTSEANTLYKEGTGYPALVPFSIDYAFVRDRCGKGGSITTMGPCPSDGAVMDTNNNAADFIFVDTNGTSAGAGQRLGAPSPHNLSSPMTLRPVGGFATALLDTCAATAAPPNLVRDFTSDPPNNSTFGTLDFRRTFINNSGGNITRLRFRIIDLTTFPAPSGIADLRPRTSSAVVVTVDRPPCGSGTSNVTVNGTTLEQPPSQPNGGGFNSTLSAGTVTLATPIANGASIDLRFLLGIQQTGAYKFKVLVEALPQGGGGDVGLQVVNFEGATDNPSVTINQAVGQSDPTSTSPINFTAVFDRSVTGFTNADVQLSGTAGATTAVVTGGPTTYNIAVSGMTGNGTVIATIPSGVATDGVTTNIASTSTDNSVDFNNPPPTVTINQAIGQADSAATSPINFTVTFSEEVTGFTDADVQLSGTAGATTAVVTGGPLTFNVAVSGMTTGGTVIATIPAGAAVDLGGGQSLASTSTDNSVTWAPGEPPGPQNPGPAKPIPALSAWMLAALTAGLALLVGAQRRRREQRT
ncbi:hypothetical protein GCM10027082_14760 [Comamonas humi]